MPSHLRKTRDFSTESASTKTAPADGISTPSPTHADTTPSAAPSFKLSAQASAIVQSGHRYIEVLACAGSGKTTVLCQRVAKLLREGEQADGIQVLSFSKAAAAQVRGRLGQLPEIVDLARDDSIDVRTCHSFANRMSNSSSRQSLTLLKPTDIKTFLRRAAKSACSALRKNSTLSKAERQHAQQYLRRLKTRDLAAISRLFDFAAASRHPLTKLAHQNPVFSGLAPHLVALKLVCKHYQRLKAKDSRIDYADMLILAATSVTSGETGPGMQSLGKLRHLLIDEYQDSSPSQVQLIAAIARAFPDLSITVFGDEHQSIYRFAGSTHTPLSSVLPDVMTLPLSRSYRLTQPNADAATALLRAGGADIRRIIGRHTTEASANAPRPVIVETGSLSAQLDAVVADILGKIGAGVDAEQIAVLARTRATLREVEAQLLDRGIFTAYKGKTRRHEHVMNVLRLVEAVERIASGQPPPSVPELRSGLRRTSASHEHWQRLSKALGKITNPSLEGRYVRCADLYLVLLGGVSVDRERRDEARRWIPDCRNYADARAMRDSIRALRQGHAVTLSTVHQAKGDEWDHVHIVGLADGQMPIYLAGDDEASLIEERNLLHVAMTRARISMRLYYSPLRHARSQKKFGEMSRFLDAPEVLRHFETEHC